MAPADLDVEDRLVGPVTFRMAGWLACAGAGLALLAAARDHPVLAPPGALLAVAGLLGACWRPGGRPAGAWLGPLLAYRRRRGQVSGRNAADGAGKRPAGVPPVEEAPAPAPGITPGRARGERLAQGWRWAVLPLVAVIAVGAALVLRAPGPAGRSGPPPPASPSPAPSASPWPAPMPPGLRGPVIVMPIVPPYLWEEDQGDPDPFGESGMFGFDCSC